MTENALALCGVKDSPGSITQALQALNELGPVVAPGGTLLCSGLAEGYGAIITAVTPTDDDVYVEFSSKKRCYTAAFLKKLAAGIGIEWDSMQTRRLDGFVHPHVCSVSVGGRYRDYSGAWRSISGDAQLDLRDEATHGVKTAGELNRMRKKIQEHTITRAKSRAIADACVKRTQSEGAIGLQMYVCKVYRTEAEPGAADAAQEALYGGAARPGETVDNETGEIHTAQAVVRDATPAVFVIPGTKLPGAGKRVTDLTDDELDACHSRLRDALDNGAVPENQLSEVQEIVAAVGEEGARRQSAGGVL